MHGHGDGDGTAPGNVEGFHHGPPRYDRARPGQHGQAGDVRREDKGGNEMEAQPTLNSYFCHHDEIFVW